MGAQWGKHGEYSWVTKIDAFLSFLEWASTALDMYQGKWISLWKV